MLSVFLMHVTADLGTLVDGLGVLVAGLL